uniref:Uncharacterized protein n=1 Tax=Ditylenchus dipsaci TaxID=166011 RepID=A0A915CVX1_9BILA
MSTKKPCHLHRFSPINIQGDLLMVDQIKGRSKKVDPTTVQPIHPGNPPADPFGSPPLRVFHNLAVTTAMMCYHPNKSKK